MAGGWRKGRPLDVVWMAGRMGSGTTGVACANTNRNFIGIEKEPQYYEIAKKRILEAERALIDAAQEPLQGELL